MSTHFQVIIWCERAEQGERAKAEMKKKRILTLIPVDLEWTRLQCNYKLLLGLSSLMERVLFVMRHVMRHVQCSQQGAL